jgi:DNA (cytosine-5)-methyltransferase 1
MNKPKVIGGIGEKDSNSGTQWKQQNRIYDNNVGISVCTCFNPNYIDRNLRIRKLTPKECFRLMGVKDEDYENIAKNQSNSKLYHLAGDSIVVDVLMAIFKELI